MVCIDGAVRNRRVSKVSYNTVEGYTNGDATERQATVNFMRNFRALSKSVEFHPCAIAQGKR